MTGKERVRSALNHKEGRIPVDFGGTTVTGIHCSVVEQLRSYYGLKKYPVRVYDPYQMLGYIDEDLRQVMGCDVIPFIAEYDVYGMRYGDHPTLWCAPWGQELLMADNFACTEENGKIYFYPGGDTTVPPSGIIPQGGYFTDAIPRQTWEIDDDQLNPEDNLEEYQRLSERDLEYIRKHIRAYEDSPYAVQGGPGGTAIGDIAIVPGIHLKHPKGVRDITEWYISLVERVEYVEAIFEKQTDIALENLQRYYEIVGDTIDVIQLCGNDFGTQISTFCSVEKFRSLYKPYYRKMTDWIHGNTNWKVFKHSCGAIEPLIGELYEAGFDIINPVQWTAKGMDPVKIKEKYGKDVTFWGGGVNTQKTLPFGKPEEVREEVLRHLEIFSRGGGYVFNTIHNIQAKVPVENVVAMVDAVHEFNGDR